MRSPAPQEDGSEPSVGSESSTHTRRAFLRRGAAATAAVGVGIGTSGSVAAEHQETQPAYVTLTYDESLIERYQPLLLLEGVEVRPEAYHAIYVESTESPLDVVVGFHYYVTQRGIDPGGSDSHLGDREPVYVYVDSETGEPVKVQYSAWHWYENTVYWESLRTEADRPILRVAPNHHHHLIATDYSAESSRVDLPLYDLRNRYPDWLRLGLEEEIHPGAVYNPLEEMQNRPYWWADGAQNYVERFIGSLQLTLGIGGASNTDLEAGLW